MFTILCESESGNNYPSSYRHRYGCVKCELLSCVFMSKVPVPVAARSKARVCGRSPAEVVDSNPTGGMDVCLLQVLCVVR
jgi:hypothetical protein